VAGILTVDTIQSDSSYASTLNVASKMNFAAGMQIGGQDATFGNRNKIINGSMQVAQRNTSAAGVVATGYYACDRMQWYKSGNAMTVTISQAADGPAGFSTCHKIQTTTANTSIASTEYTGNLYYTVENKDMQDLAWGTASAKPMTLSFWVKSNKTGTYSVSPYLAISGSYYIFGSTYTINAADTWEYKTIVIPGFTTTAIPNDNGGAFQLYLNVRCGTGYTTGTAATTWSTYTTTNWAVGHTAQWGTSTSDYISVTGLQLEKGSAATAFEYRPYQQELALCQRYLPSFEFKAGQELSIVGMSYSSTYGFYSIPYQVTPRSAATGISYNGTVTNLQIYQGGSNVSLTGLILASATTTYMTLRGQTASGLTAGYASALSSELSASTKIFFTGCEL
jgi:hypothetical protein